MNIKNETIKKLTRKEMNGIGCFNSGIVTVIGTAKQRLKGLKTTLKSETEMHYESEYLRHELIKLADEDNENCAYRMFNKETNKYEDFVQPLVAIEFVK